LGGEDNRYFSVDASLAIKNTPLSLAGSFGIEHGAFGSSKRDWSFGLNADFDRFTLGVSYYDTARSGGDPNGKASLVGWLTAKF
jgi:tetrahydromethanopterin S-methyltransferase subunit E